MHAEVWFDGASRGNPGAAGAGAVMDLDGQRHVFTKRLGRATNNEAEWHAVLLGLQGALDAGATKVTLRGDSQLVIRQLEGKYRVKAVNLQGLHQAAIQLCHRFPEGVLPEWVRREQNGDADAAANAAIDGTSD